MILIVDDDPEFLRSAVVALQSDKGVYFASNAADALALLKAMEFSIALIDLDLPDRTGFELIEEVRRKHPMVPVIAISAVFSGSALESAKEFGATEVLHKPVSPAWLKVVSRLRATCRQDS